MGTQESKRIVTEYFEAVGGGDFEKVVGLFSDDIRWWVPPSSPLAGTYEGKEAVLGMFGKGTDLYAPEPMKIDVVGLVGEDDKVAAEIVIDAKTAKGEDYHNHYHFLFEIRGGQIVSVKEYVDTLYAQRTLFA